MQAEEDKFDVFEILGYKLIKPLGCGPFGRTSLVQNIATEVNNSLKSIRNNM